MNATKFYYLKSQNNPDKPALLDNGFQPGYFYYCQIEGVRPNGKEDRYYSRVPIDQVNDLLSTDKHIFEILDFNGPITYKHDIDAEGEGETLKLVVEGAKAHLLQKLLDIGWNQQPKFLVAHTPNKSKVSVHIMISNLVFRNQAEYNEFQQICMGHRLWERNDFGKRNQQVRCLNQSKIGKNALRIYEGNFTPSEFLMQYRGDISDNNIGDLLQKYFNNNINKQLGVKTLTDQNYCKNVKKYRNSSSNRQFVYIVGDWLKQLKPEHYQDCVITPDSSYISFLLSKIPNPNCKEAYCPYVVWVRICGILAHLELQGQGNYRQLFIEFSILPNEYFGGNQEQEAGSLYNYFLTSNRDNDDLFYDYKHLEQIVLLLNRNITNLKQLYNNSNDIMFQDIQPHIQQSEQRFSDYGISLDNGKVQIIKAPMGAGKSTAAKQLIESNFVSNEAVVFITPRVSLSYDIYNNGFKQIGFKHYIINRSEVYKSQCNRFICQLDSMVKIYPGRFNDKKLVIFIDECETFFNHFNFVIENNRSHAIKNFITMLQQCEYVFFMDAYISQRTIQFVNMVCGNHIFIDNRFVVIQREVQLVRSINSKFDIKEFQSECVGFIKQLLQQNKNVYFCCESAKLLVQIQQSLIGEGILTIEQLDIYQQKYPLYDQTDMQKRLQNVEEYWYGKRFIGVNSAISVGVNFNREWFDCCVMYSSGGSAGVRDMVQSHCRVRQLKDSKVYVFLNYAPMDYNVIVHKNMQQFKNNNPISMIDFGEWTNAVQQVQYWNKYEQQMSNHSRMFLYKYYFNQAGYQLVDMPMTLITENVELVGVKQWDIYSELFKFSYAVFNFWRWLENDREKLDQYFKGTDFTIDDFDYFEEEAKYSVLGRCASIDEQKYYKVNQMCDRYGRYLKPDISEENYLNFYEQIIEYDSVKNVVDKILYSYKGDKRLASQAFRPKLDIVSKFVKASNCFQQPITYKVLRDWFQEYSPRIEEINKMFSGGSNKRVRIRGESVSYSNVSNMLENVFGIKLVKVKNANGNQVRMLVEGVREYLYDFEFEEDCEFIDLLQCIKL